MKPCIEIKSKHKLGGGEGYDQDIFKFKKLVLIIIKRT